MKKLKWGILGTGFITNAVIPAMKQGKLSEPFAIASRSKKKADEHAKKFGIPCSFGSYQELLDSKTADLIYIALPNSMHAEWTIKALEAGYDVLCEKPLTMNEAEAIEIAKTAKGSGRTVAEAFMYRHHPQYAKVMEIIASGKIGKTSIVRSTFTFMCDDSSSSVVSKDLGGGALFDVGCYCVNIARLITGNEPLKVSAFEKRSNVDETMVGIMKFPGDVLSTFETGVSCFERRHAEIIGTTGAILIHEPWIPFDNEATLTLHMECKPSQEIVIPKTNSYLLEIEEFAGAVLEKRPPKWPISDSVANMKVIDELFRSASYHA